MRTFKNTIAIARESVSIGSHHFGPGLTHLVDEFMALDLHHSKEIWPLLSVLLKELSLINEKEVFFSEKFDPSLNSVISTCSWKSPKLKQQASLKFSLKNGIFYFFSLRRISR